MILYIILSLKILLDFQNLTEGSRMVFTESEWCMIYEFVRMLAGERERTHARSLEQILGETRKTTGSHRPPNGKCLCGLQGNALDFNYCRPVRASQHQLAGLGNGSTRFDFLSSICGRRDFGWRTG